MTLNPLQGSSGNYEVPPVYWLNPASDGPFDNTVVTSVVVDVLNLDTVPSSVIASGASMTWDANAKAHRLLRPTTDLSGVRQIGFLYRPTSTASGSLVYKFLRRERVTNLNAALTSMPTDVRTEMDANSLLANATFGLSALNADLDTLLARLTNGRATLLDALSLLDAAVTSRSTPGDVTAARDAVLTQVATRLAASQYVAPDNAGIATLLSRLSSQRATLLDNLAALDVAITTRATPADVNAARDAVLASIAQLTTLVANPTGLKAAVPR